MSSPKKKMLLDPNLNKDDSMLDPRGSFNYMTDPLVLQIASSFNIEDLISFSLTCKNVQEICDRDNKIWLMALKREDIKFAQDFLDAAAATIDKQNKYMTTNANKLAVLLYRRTKQNWMTAKSQQVKVDCDSEVKFTNRSSFYLQTSSRCENQNLKFSLWDIRSGEIGETLSMNWPSHHQEEKFHFLFNKFVLASFTSVDDQGSLVVQTSRYKLRFQETELVSEWTTKIAYLPYTILSQVIAFEDIFAYFVKKQNTIGLSLEGFNTTNGSRLFSHNINELSSSSFDSILSESCDVWFVFWLKPRLVAINYNNTTNNNSMRIIKDNYYSLSQMVLRSGKVVCHQKNGTVTLFDLSSGSIIWTSKLLQTNSIAIEINPVTHKADFWYANPRYSFGNINTSFSFLSYHPTMRCWIHEIFDGTELHTAAEFHCTPTFATFSCCIMFGTFVRLERVFDSKQVVTQFCLQISGPKGNVWSDVDHCKSKSSPESLSFTHISPFFVAVGNTSQKYTCQIYDFLNLRK